MWEPAQNTRCDSVCVRVRAWQQIAIGCKRLKDLAGGVGRQLERTPCRGTTLKSFGELFDQTFWKRVATMVAIMQSEI